jgi:hypothetical protein
VNLRAAVDHMHGVACAVQQVAEVATADAPLPQVARGMTTKLTKDRMVRLLQLCIAKPTRLVVAVIVSGPFSKGAWCLLSPGLKPLLHPMQQLLPICVSCPANCSCRWQRRCLSTCTAAGCTTFIWLMHTCLLPAAFAVAAAVGPASAGAHAQQ